MNCEEWNERWLSPEWVAGTDPHVLLVNEVDALPPGTALDLGCGNGRDSVWLAERGWAVTGVDFSDVALDKARTLAQERGASVAWVQADLLTYAAPPHAFDLVVIMYLHFPPRERQRLLRMASSAVRPGGSLVMVGYHRDHRGLRWPNMRDRTRLLSPRAIASELPDLRIVKAARVSSEEWSPAGMRPTVEVVVHAERSAPLQR
jgi:SAM-dependent methyltransferase